MLPRVDPTQTQAWKALEAHAATMKSAHLRDLFAQDPRRYEAFACCFEHILIDFSKNLLQRHTLDLLLALARECQLPEAIE